MNPRQAIEFLRTAGWSDHKIATGAETTTPTIWRIRTSTSGPSYHLGAALIALAKREQAKAKKAAA